MCVCVCIYVTVHIFVCICVWVCMYTCTCTCVCVCVERTAVPPLLGVKSVKTQAIVSFPLCPEEAGTEVGSSPSLSVPLSICWLTLCCDSRPSSSLALTSSFCPLPSWSSSTPPPITLRAATAWDPPQVPLSLLLEVINLDTAPAWPSQDAPSNKVCCCPGKPVGWVASGSPMSSRAELTWGCGTWLMRVCQLGCGCVTCWNAARPC